MRSGKKNNIFYELKPYQESNYTYASKNQAISTQLILTTYNNSAPHSINHFEFKLLLTHDIIGDPKEKSAQPLRKVFLYGQEIIAQISHATFY